MPRRHIMVKDGRVVPTGLDASARGLYGDLHAFFTMGSTLSLKGV